MNPISSQLDSSLTNAKLDEMKQKAESSGRFQEVLKAEQKGNVNPNNKLPVNQKLMDVCHEFEAIMIGQMLKTMRSTVHKKDSLLYGGQAEEIFDDMLYEQHALNMSKSYDFGLAQQIYDQMSQNNERPGKQLHV